MTGHASTTPPPTHRPRPAALGSSPTLTDSQTLALESFADTIIPGCKRSATDLAIAGISDSPGAVECGALQVLCDPATGIEDGIDAMADLLDERAISWARDHDIDNITRFADLQYPDRRRLVAALTAHGEKQRDLWFLVALFANMAFDSAPHLETADALSPEITPASGLRQMGFFPPQDGRWQFPRASYGRQLARLRSGTDEGGNPQ